MGEFAAGRDLKIHVAPTGTGTMHMASEGLAARGLPELELVAVPADHVKNGGVIINRIAEYSVNRARIQPGQRIGLEGPRAALVARLVPGAAGPKRLRIEEPIDGMKPLTTLMATVQLWRAEAAFDANDEATGIELLRTSIAQFPGEPLRRKGEPDLGVPYNWENHLAYATLAEYVGGDEAFALWQEAAARSGFFEREHLGDAAATLVRLEPRTLLARARVILDLNRRVTHDEPINDVVFVTLSPIWRPVRDNTGALKAARKMNVVPRRHAFSGEPLLAEPALLQAAVDLVLAHKQRPVALVWATAGIVTHWEGGSQQAPFQPAGAGYIVGDHVLSRALAQVARFVAAGMTVHEVRVACGLADDPAARESAWEKQREQLAAILADQMAAMRPPEN